MKRLLIFADIHGNFNTWLTIRAMLNKDDGLVVAGDLFDTRYGSYSNPDFQPGDIRSDLKTLPHPFHYVYGNCDVSSYLPGFDTQTTFEAFGRTIGLHHGHRPFTCSRSVDVLIQGHTHVCHLARENGTIFMNPGSITSPRNKMVAYGVMDQTGIALVALQTGEPLAAIPFS